jgi:hypothetical protein
MSRHMDVWNVDQWDGALGDPEGDPHERWDSDGPRYVWSQRDKTFVPAIRAIYKPERYLFTRVRRCTKCDGFMSNIRAYTPLVSEERATSCHHCRGDVLCSQRKHHIKPGAWCAVCAVFPNAR